MAKVAEEGHRRIVDSVDPGLPTRPDESDSGGGGNSRGTPWLWGTTRVALVLPTILGIYRRSVVGIVECEVDVTAGVC